MVFKFINRKGTVHNELAKEIRSVELLVKKAETRLDDVKITQDLLTLAVGKLTDILERIVNILQQMK